MTQEDLTKIRAFLKDNAIGYNNFITAEDGGKQWTSIQLSEKVVQRRANVIQGRHIDLETEANDDVQEVKSGFDGMKQQFITNLFKMKETQAEMSELQPEPEDDGQMTVDKVRSGAKDRSPE